MRKRHVEWRYSGRWRWTRHAAVLLVALALAAVLLSGCGEDPEEELDGKFGNGNDSAAYTGGPDVEIDLTKSSGSVFGVAEYDSNFFVFVPPEASGDFGTVVDNADEDLATVAVTLIRISGRADTPCRYQAAVLARDEDYTIEESGTRKNAHNIEFYQVNLKKSGTHLSVFCAQMSGEVGVSVQVIAASSALIKSEQVHFILNSIRKD